MDLAKVIDRYKPSRIKNRCEVLLQIQMARNYRAICI